MALNDVKPMVWAVGCGGVAGWDLYATEELALAAAERMAGIESQKLTDDGRKIYEIVREKDFLTALSYLNQQLEPESRVLVILQEVFTG